MKLKQILSYFIFLLVLAIGCTDQSNQHTNTHGRLSVRLTDAPFPYDLIAEANVTVFKIEARLKSTADQEDENVDASMNADQAENQESNSPFIVLMEEEIDVNLLDLTNGNTLLMADLEVPVGSIDLVRFYVKGVNVLLTDGRTFDLKVPSGAQTGIKVFIKPELVISGGLSSDLLLDFDVCNSFVPKGNLRAEHGITGFNFKPVIKASNLSTAGTLSGVVSVLEEEMEVGLEGAQISVMAADTINTTGLTNAEGNYTIMGLTAGSYRVFAEKEGYLASDTVQVQIDAANFTEQNFLLEPEAATDEETDTEGGN